MGALHLVNIEIRNPDPARLPLALQLRHHAPTLLKDVRVFDRPMDLVEVDSVYVETAETGLAFPADRGGVQNTTGLTLGVPTETAFGEDVRPAARPPRERLAYDLFRLPNTVNPPSVDPAP